MPASCHKNLSLCFVSSCPNPTYEVNLQSKALVLIFTNKSILGVRTIKHSNFLVHDKKTVTVIARHRPPKADPKETNLVTSKPRSALRSNTKIASSYLLDDTFFR